MTHEFSKTVAIKAVDDDEMTATGVVMTPNELDHQLDWLDADGIEAMYNDSPADGVMHTSFPDGHATLEFNEVLDEPTTIDGVEFDAGEWVIRRRYEDDRRWQLVKDGILSAYSIGGEVSSVEQYESVDELPDEVDTSKVNPDAVDSRYWPPSKIVDGEVSEISDVDIGAVPSADMAVVKAAGTREKNIFERAGGREEFIELMAARGHDAEEATRLWQYLDRNKTANEPAESGVGDDSTDDMSNDDDTADEETDTPDEASKTTDVEQVDDATLGSRLKNLLLGGGGADDDTTSEDPDAKEAGHDLAKVGQTLSERNQRAVMASVDAQLDLLDDAGVDHGMTRFTDRSDVEFDVRDYGKGDYEDKAIGNEDAPDGDTSDEKETMSDDTSDTDADVDKSANDPMADAPEWAKAIQEQTEKNAERLNDIEDDEDATKAIDDAPEWAKAIHEQTEKNAERIDAVAKGAAESDQIEASAETDDAEGEGLDKVASLLG